MKRLVVLTGAGMSAESGLATFRDSGGLWEGHDVTQVASPEGWASNPELVLDFYNQRRRQALHAEPNAGHTYIAKLQEYFEVTVVTQNIDHLHEKAGSTNVVHLHGSVFEKRSSLGDHHIQEELGDITLGDLAPDGSQYRPNIVWFGEPVPMIESAAHIATTAEIFLVVGTSLVVYPAASLLNFINHSVPKYIVDPNIPEVGYLPGLQKVEAGASEGMKIVFDLLT